MPLDALTAAAVERLKAAVKDCPVGRNSHPEVIAADVLAVATLIKDPTPEVAALVKGAEGAAKHRHGKTCPNADVVRHLLECAGV